MTQNPDRDTLWFFRQGLEWLYGKAVSGVPTLDGAGDLAASYERRFSSREDAVDGLIKWQTATAGTASFVSSIGGVLSLPISVPANLTSVTYIQIRMIAAIAQLRGHDIRDDQVRAIALACFLGTSLIDLAKGTGLQLGTYLAQQACKRVSGDALKPLNTALACRLAALTGTTAPVNLAKLVPVLGGVISGGVDAAVTRGYGKTAKRVFQPVAA